MTTAKSELEFNCDGTVLVLTASKLELEYAVLVTTIADEVLKVPELELEDCAGIVLVSDGTAAAEESEIELEACIVSALV
jgi:hypothetical protein